MSDRRTGGRSGARHAIGATNALAEFCAGLRLPAIPSAVVERTKDLLLDHLGVALFGSTLPWSRSVRAIVMGEGARAQSTLYGWGRSSPRGAALANGAAAHAIEYDDTHDEAMQHPGCVVIPAALAIGEALDRTGAEILTAIVGGYEVECRIGATLGAELMRRGFHATAVCGVYGASAAASMLLRQSPETMASAFGLGASMSAGTMQFSEDSERNTIKRLYSGLPAERGVLAALLAGEGFSGPRAAIEGRWGLARVFTGITDLARATRSLGSALEIERITVKLYPCCKQFHALIEAIDECRKQQRFAPEDVVAVEVFGTHAMIDTHMEFRPRSTMAAQYSLPYTTAAAIALDPRDAASFAAPTIQRSDVLRLADRVDAHFDETLEAHFPRKYPGGVRIRLRGGRELRATILDALSSPDRPIGRTDIERKFLAVTTGVLSPAQQLRLVEFVTSFDRHGSARDLAAGLRNVVARRQRTAAPARQGSRHTKTHRGSPATR
jgi:2-methylcitrate dehydratase PrpD